MSTPPLPPPRLKTEFRVSALLRRCNDAGAFAVLVRRGDADAGTILLRLEQAADLSQGGDTADILMPAISANGTKVWRRLNGATPVDAARAQSLIDRELRVDPDLWIISIEARGDLSFLDEAVQE